MKRELGSGWKRTAPLARGAPLKRTQFKRNSKRRRSGAEERFRREVVARSGGSCERCGRSDRSVQAHHIVPRSRAVGKPWLHDAERNGAALCFDCHSAVHDHRCSDWQRWLKSEPTRPAGQDDVLAALHKIGPTQPWALAAAMREDGMQIAGEDAQEKLDRLVARKLAQRELLGTRREPVYSAVRRSK